MILREQLHKACWIQLRSLPQHQQCLPLNFFQQITVARSTSMSSITSVKSSTRDGDQIIVRLVQPYERLEVLSFMRLHYYREEPLTAGSEPKQQDKEDEDWTLSQINDGICFIALQKPATHIEKNIVGAVVAGAKGPDEAVKLFKAAAKLGPTKLGHILQFTACVERDANVFKRFKVKNVLHIHILAVEQKMRGQNIGYRVIQKLLQQAKNLKYEMVTVDCTSFYSARLFERMGFECLNIKYYTDYVNEAGEQVFKPEAPHECVKTFAYTVNKTN